MAIINIVKVDFDTNNPNTGAIYHEKITVLTTATSDTYLLPTFRIYAIAAVLTGTGKVDFSVGTEAELLAGTATWSEWDGTSYINPGVTAFRVRSISGTVVLEITVKTSNA